MSTARILVAEDEKIARENLEHSLAGKGYDVAPCATGDEAVDRLRHETFDLVITDLRMPGVDGLEVLRRAKELQPAAEVLVVTGYATVDNAVEAMNLGAYHYLSKPVNIRELHALVRKALEKGGLRREVRELRERVDGRKGPPIIGQSPAMQKLKEDIARVATVDSTVLVTGETGTGKELVARAVHILSGRSAKRFLAVNCGAFNKELLANELFGHESGAFTGAREARKGLMESADGGTFFLDEIGDMELSMQVKLLRVLEERTLIRVGGTREKPVDLRVLAATNKDLALEVEEGAFRRDLYYRLNVITLAVPPLRERREDIGLLAAFFLDRFASSFGKTPPRFDQASLDILAGYEFPGNVRELENIVERAVVLCDKDVITPEHLPPDLAGGGVRLASQGACAREMISLRENEKRHLAWVLEQCGGNRTQAAEILEIDRATIWRKLKRYGLEDA